MNSSESDAGCTAWRSSDSHGCTTDLVTESIVRLSDTFHIVTWNGTTASGRGGVGATASSIFLLFISICSPRRLVAHSSSDTTCSLLVLVLVLLLSVSVVIVGLILAIVVSANAETGGTTWLVMHSHGGSAYFVSKDIE